MNDREERNRRPARGPQFDWKRFWIRSALWMLAFNIVAIIVVWFFLMPRLHPEAFGAG